MKGVLAVTIICITLALVGATAPLLNMNSESIVPDEYIVIFKDHVTVQTRDMYLASLSATFGGSERIKHRFDIGTSFVGYSAVFSKTTLTNELENPMVAFIEANTVMKVADTAVTQTSATWGIDRISQRTLPLDGNYEYWESAGEGVNAYIVDTGIRITHQDFGGRAVWGTNTVDSTTTDGNGHGTHVASTTGGVTYGVAKKCTLIAVKVLSDSGSGTTDGVIAGVTWVANDHVSKKGKSTANMSLGGGASSALDKAVADAIAKGVVFVVAAGNSNANACNTSPARVAQAITVGATTDKDARSSFSNYGTCVDIFAPGSAILGAWYTSNTATNTISGTSMASPHVCGAVAVYLGHADGNTAAGAAAFLDQVATPNVVGSPGTGSPNRLLYSPFQ